MRIATFICATLAALALGSLPAEAGVKISKQDISLKTAAYEIELEYPRTGNPAVDAALTLFVRQRIAEYKSDSADHQKDENPYSFDVSYSVERNDVHVFAVLFSESSYTGGAHPNGFFYSLNFLMPDGAQVFLPEVLDGKRGLARLSQYAIADLKKQMDGPDSMSDDDWLKRGAGPPATNFAVFILQPDYIDIQFPPYQVAAYAAGPQEVKVPLGFLKGFIRKDWRAPQPSFSCAKAATPIEHAVCADASLARMDRQAAEYYAEHLANAYQKGEADKWRQSQRAWVASRDAACGVSAPSDCLKNSYAARLAVLRKYGPAK